MAAGLNREKIVTVALQLLNEVGFEALTTRLLAHELGVQQPALYHHFKSKRDLADAMAAAMVSPEEWPGPQTPGLMPEQWLTARAHAFRRSLLAYRDGALIHAGTSPEPESYGGMDERVAALVAYGLAPADALRTLLAVSRFTLGWAVEEQALNSRVEADGERLANVQQPTLKRAVSSFRKGSPTANFDYGLRRLVNGLLSSPDAPITSKGKSTRVKRVR